jgi:hypothetical protein
MNGHRLEKRGESRESERRDALLLNLGRSSALWISNITIPTMSFPPSNWNSALLFDFFTPLAFLVFFSPVGAASSIGVGRGEPPGVTAVDEDEEVEMGVELDLLDNFLGNFIFGMNPVDSLGVGAAS